VADYEKELNSFLELIENTGVSKSFKEKMYPLVERIFKEFDGELKNELLTLATECAITKAETESSLENIRIKLGEMQKENEYLREAIRITVDLVKKKKEECENIISSHYLSKLGGKSSIES
jgi:hypothetical protein